MQDSDKAYKATREHFDLHIPEVVLSLPCAGDDDASNAVDDTDDTDAAVDAEAEDDSSTSNDGGDGSNGSGSDTGTGTGNNDEPTKNPAKPE